MPGDASLAVIDPATEEIFEHAHRASLAQLEAAIAAAQAAWPQSALSSLSSRKELLQRMAAAVENAAEELAELVVRETGMPIAKARREVQGLAHCLRGACMFDLSPRDLGQGSGRNLEEHRRPLGVVAAIVPWNHPALLIGAKIGPALLAGNGVIIKPAPSTPLTALALGALFAKIVPAGLLNVIVDDDDLGPVMSEHPGIAKISFTGSTETGKRIMGAGASTLKHLTLELGGNDPAIVFEDVDIPQTAAVLFDAAFRNTGQGCTATKRIYVQAAIYRDFAETMEQLVSAVKVGNGFDPETQFGPLQNRRQFDRLLHLIADSRARGAKICGGEVIKPGFFIRPAIVTGLSDGAPLVDEEQFGPVLPLVPFENEADIVRRVNAGPYGLGAMVWSRDEERAYRVAQQLVVGTVAINKPMLPGVDIPFSGAKESGLGVENGLEGLHAFTQIQVIER